jgi:hypothetical protein
MPTELENSLRAAAEKVAKYVGDVATLVVETSYAEVVPGGGATFADAKAAARTEIKIDGDCKAIIPMVKAPATGALEIDAALLEVHERNVQAAIDYRAKMMAALWGALQGRR